MKKMRKFAWMFMAAMTVAGFSACNNAEEEPLPGLGGDDNNDPTTPSVVLTDTIYHFDNIEANYTPINELCEGWAHEIVSPADDDRTWQAKMYNEEKYVQATAHDGSDSNAGKEYDLWMITPALDVKNATEKVFSFYTQGSYWTSTSKMEVYVLNKQSSDASSKILLNVKIATQADGNYTWIASGDIDLSSYGDVVYVAFRYVAQGGKSNSTTYCIDDVAFGRKQVAMGGGETPDTPDTPDTPAEVTGKGTQDSPYTANDVILLNNTAKGPFYVKAYIVGQVNGTNVSESTIETAAPFTPASGKTYNTNLLIASNPDETDVAKMVPVQLPSGELRTSLNLPENEGMNKKEILLYGNLEAYFKIPGVKSPSYAVVDGKEYGVNPGGTVVEPEATPVSVSDFIAAPESKEVYYELTGTIGGSINTTYGNFDLVDETGSVYVYGLTATYIPAGGSNDKSYASLNLKEGDNITIRGYRGSYGDKVEVLGAYFVKKN